MGGDEIHTVLCLIQHMIYQQKLIIILRIIQTFNNNSFWYDDIGKLDGFVVKKLYTIHNHSKLVKFVSSFFLSFDEKSSICIKMIVIYFSHRIRKSQHLFHWVICWLHIKIISHWNIIKTDYCCFQWQKKTPQFQVGYMSLTFLF